jgi:hypothetical protein
MLLPGASYFFAFVLLVAWLVIAAIIGLAGAALFHKIAGPILEKTQLVIWMKEGRKPPKGSWPWWCFERNWAIIGWLVLFLIALYCWAGPVCGLLQTIK